jgi:predicted Zn-dependent peptidase
MNNEQSTMNNQLIRRFILDNGITVLVSENQAADLIAARIFLKNAGSKWESREKAGLSHLIASVITKGTETMSSVEIADRVESTGASLGADASTDYFLVSIKTVTADFAEMLKLAGEIIRHPTFPEAEVELEKYLTGQNIRSQQEQPFNIAFNQLREMLYRSHPYGLSVLGTEETVSNLTHLDLQNYHRTHFRPDNLVVSISGRITAEKAVSLIEEVFGDWQIPRGEIIAPPLPPLFSEPQRKIIPQNSQQAILMLGYLAAAVQHQDYPVLKLINTYLGNGLSSRLFVELREKRGLAYDVSAFYPTRLDDSHFVAYIGTAPENAEMALEGLRTEIDRLCHTQLSEAELQAAKNKLLGQYALGKQTNAEIAQIYGWYESLGLGIEFDHYFQEQVRQVTVTMVQNVAQSFFGEPYISGVGCSL